MLEQLGQSVKTLQASTSELTRKSGLHEERIKKLEIANAEFAKKNTELETRIKAEYVLALSSTAPYDPSTPSRPSLFSSPMRIRLSISNTDWDMDSLMLVFPPQRTQLLRANPKLPTRL